MASLRIERIIEAPLKKVWDAADFIKSAASPPSLILHNCKNKYLWGSDNIYSDE